MDTRRIGRRRALVLGAGTAGALAVAGCGTGRSAGPAPAGSSGPVPASGIGTPRQDGAAAKAPPELTPVLATSELVVGRNRFALGLIGADAKPLLDATVNLDFFELDGQVGTKREEAQARFRWVELRAKGIYTATVAFDKPGRWGVEVRAAKDGRTLVARLPFEVRASGQAPAIGSPAPRVPTLTPADGRDPIELCTAVPQCDLHAASLDAVIGRGRPTVVLFATPGFCTSATCAPQHGVFLEARTRHPDRAHYAHVEIFKDPRNMVVADAVTGWGLPSEPWVFFVDGGGTIVERFEGIATLEELEGALALLG